VLNSSRPGVIGRQRERQVTVKAVQQIAKVSGSACNILFGIERIVHIPSHGRVGHELHQADGPRPRHRIRIKIGFCFNDGADQGGI